MNELHYNMATLWSPQQLPNEHLLWYTGKSFNIEGHRPVVYRIKSCPQLIWLSTENWLQVWIVIHCYSTLLIKDRLSLTLHPANAKHLKIFPYSILQYITLGLRLVIASMVTHTQLTGQVSSFIIIILFIPLSVVRFTGLRTDYGIVTTLSLYSVQYFGTRGVVIGRI